MYSASAAWHFTASRGVTRGARGHNSLGAESLRGAELLREAPKNLNNVTSIFFNTVNLLPKELRFNHEGDKLAFCPGRHLALLRP